jgi:hypothetical protein
MAFERHLFMRLQHTVRGRIISLNRFQCTKSTFFVHLSIMGSAIYKVVRLLGFPKLGVQPLFSAGDLDGKRSAALLDQDALLGVRSAPAVAATGSPSAVGR